MLSKEELLTKDISELENIAQSLGVTNEFDDDKEGLIYAILDRQADRGAAEQAAPLKRKRVRIAKKDTDRVYTVNGREGENFDVKKNKIKNEAPSLFKIIVILVRGRVCLCLRPAGQALWSQDGRRGGVSRWLRRRTIKDIECGECALVFYRQ